MQKYFCSFFYVYVEKADFSMCYWKPDTKLGVEASFFFFFLDNYKQQLFQKEVKYKAMHVFFQIEALLSLKNA